MPFSVILCLKNLVYNEKTDTFFTYMSSLFLMQIAICWKNIIERPSFWEIIYFTLDEKSDTTHTSMLNMKQLLAAS